MSYRGGAVDVLLPLLSRQVLSVQSALNAGAGAVDVPLPLAVTVVRVGIAECDTCWCGQGAVRMKRSGWLLSTLRVDATRRWLGPPVLSAASIRMAHICPFANRCRGRQSKNAMRFRRRKPLTRERPDLNHTLPADATVATLARCSTRICSATNRGKTAA